MASPERIARVRAEFRDRFGAEPRLFRAPGRVNLIGEHTDYNDGFVLPFAIGERTVATAAPRADDVIAVASASVAGTVRCSPSRSTRASGAVSSDRAAMALPAFISWVTPAAVFTTITSRMTPASVQSPVASVSTAATSSTITSGSRSWPPISSQNEVRRARGSSFGP